MEVDLSKFHKEVIAPFSGQVFTIRRVRLKEFMTHIGGLALPMNTTVEEAIDKLRDKIAETAEKDTELEDKIQRFYIAKGTVDPKVWTGPEEQCPPGWLSFEDLGNDVEHLAAAIVMYSNEVSSLKDVEKFFRESGATRAPAPDGEDLRPAAEQPLT
jgi:hypothetical protein